ncbi:IclR family transcriptional regulator [Hoeflea sp. G2-23]|uniref:IclR family transcriptional regulator n=1 Tax=Hoeflea algicola TaxID=2983763 RepID=A0ABT3Z5T7_9HYPH|nr:IclR family transcriptional regulator [Hoeflea algicola]MCY0147128.1 IclR family transcriptional regulator [Hoeflea algicola]
MTDTSDTVDMKSGKYTAPALSKGLDILELLASDADGMRKSDIAKALERSISEIFRMLAVLTERGYVSFEPSTERYALTTKLFEIAHRHPPIRRLSSVAIETMRKLALEVNQSIHLAIQHGDDILIIAQVDAPGNNVTSVRLGARVPMEETASGAILFSALTENEQKKFLQRAKDREASIVDSFLVHFDAFRKRGYCQSPSAVIEGVINISVPLRDYSGAIIAALTIPFVNRLRTPHFVSLEETKALLIDAGREVSALLGSNTFAGDHDNR